MSVIDSTSQGSVCFGMTSYVKVADAYGNPLRMQNVNPYYEAGQFIRFCFEIA